MGGETPLRTDLSNGSNSEDISRESRRRVALAQLILGAPTLLLVVFGLVLGFRFSGRPLGDAAFWAVLIPVIGVFGAYYVRAIVALRRSSGP